MLNAKSPVDLRDSDLSRQPWAEQPSVVEFWSFRCEACRFVATVTSELAREHGGTLAVFKVNVDDNPRLTALFGATVVPSARLFRAGKPVGGWLRERWSVADVLAEMKA